MVGMMQRALDMSIGRAKQRATLGRPIADRQAIQWMIAEMRTDIQDLRTKL
jgi:alkylation response protein AidB-like acyl-CoA dehydrogenase